MQRNYSIPTIIALLAIIQAGMLAQAAIPDVKDFFAKTIEGNLTKVTWAHAVNSQEELEKALANDKIMMLEADVVIGFLNDTVNNVTLKDVPIMAHPPAMESDLSLEEFLESTVNGKRGIKLDFKTITAFNGSLEMLRKYRENFTVPVWLNADILDGPVDAEKGDTKPVDKNRFLLDAANVLPESTLSIGWTTRYGAKDKINKGSYTQDQIQSMVAAVVENKIKQSITYPVRAGLAANAASVLKKLLKDTEANNPTLTIWSHKDDEVDVSALSTLIKDIGVKNVYVDVPEDLWAKLDIKSAAPTLVTSSVVLVGSVVASLALTKLV